MFVDDLGNLWVETNEEKEEQGIQTVSCHLERSEIRHFSIKRPQFLIEEFVFSDSFNHFFYFL